MTTQRVILLGVCGIHKNQYKAGGPEGVANRLADCCKKYHGQTVDIVDFEHQFLSVAGEKPYRSFLLDPPHEQFKQWREGWSRLKQSVDLENLPQHTLLVMHGAIVKGQYGARAIVDYQCLADFRPNLVITLVDNVYDMWWRTEGRAMGEPFRGRPTLEQLLMARRFEQAVGDQIANTRIERKNPATDRMEVVPRARHVVVSVHHPCECAARFILGRPRVIYLAFPISEPRRMIGRQPSDPRGIELTLQRYLLS